MVLNTIKYYYNIIRMSEKTRLIKSYHETFPQYKDVCCKVDEINLEIIRIDNILLNKSWLRDTLDEERDEHFKQIHSLIIFGIADNVERYERELKKFVSNEEFDIIIKDKPKIVKLNRRRNHSNIIKNQTIELFIEELFFLYAIEKKIFDELKNYNKEVMNIDKSIYLDPWLCGPYEKRREELFIKIKWVRFQLINEIGNKRNRRINFIEDELKNGINIEEFKKIFEKKPKMKILNRKKYF
jgi:hypothetical protein